MSGHLELSQGFEWIGTVPALLAGKGHSGLAGLPHVAIVQPAAQAQSPPDLPPASTMITNDVLRSVRYMLDLSDARIIEIAQLSDPAFALDRDTLANFLKREGEPGFETCDDRTLLHFLDGLVLHCRGKDESRPARPIEARVSNNLVLKKLRVAFELKDADMHRIFEEAGFPVSKPELSALFRQRDHKNYRACGDQMLRNFLKGLTLRFRGV